MGARFDIDWDDVGLGTVADVVLAKKLQVSSRKVQQERCDRGIEAAPNDFIHGQRRGVNWDKEPLGKVPDEVLAKKWEVDPRSVGDVRRARGIAAYSKQKRDHRLAGKSDACIDQALLLTPSQTPDDIGDLIEVLTANGWSVIFTPE